MGTVPAPPARICGFDDTSVETFDTLSAMAAPALGPKARAPTTNRRPSPRSPSRPGSRRRPSPRSSTAARTWRAETRRRVEAAIRDAGYRRPQSTARRAPLIELIFHELESEWALEIVRGVERVAGQHHLAVVLSEMQGRRTPGRGWIEGVLARRPTGVIAVFSDLCDVMREQLRSRGIPFVVVDPTGEPLHDTPSVGATNWNGGLTATRHLLGLGHRRIGVIGGPEWILCSRARIDGYRAAMDEAGVPVDPALVEPRQVPRRRGHRQGPRAPAAAGPPDGHLRGQRPPGARRLPGRARGTTAHPGRPERRRLRRPAGRPLGRPAADDDPPAARPDGGRRRGARPARWRDGEPPAQPRVELATDLVDPREHRPAEGAAHPRETRRRRETGGRGETLRIAPTELRLRLEVRAPARTRPPPPSEPAMASGAVPPVSWTANGRPPRRARSAARSTARRWSSTAAHSEQSPVPPRERRRRAETRPARAGRRSRRAADRRSTRQSERTRVASATPVGR